MTLTRRDLLVTGGVGIGLVVAWEWWPRRYRPNLAAAPGETVLGAWLKIGEDGHVTVAVPQAEHGQGVYTALAQIVADRLGADWRTVGVEAAPINPLYGNPLGLAELTGTTPGRPFADGAPMLTGGSSSVRQFGEPAAHAGAAARVLLCQAAARGWGADWRTCGVDAGFVTCGKRRRRFAELAAAAARETVPVPLPLDASGTGRLVGQPLPRLDAPAKVDGSANFAGDIRLPDMVHAAIRAAPPGGRLVGADRAAAARVRGVVAVLEQPGWIAAAATTGWAAERALDALDPRFTPPSALDDAGVARALDAALARPGTRMATVGKPDPLLAGAGLIEARYAVRAGVAAPIETPSATAHLHDGRLELWLPTQAPGRARAAAAQAAGLSEERVTVHPTLIGGSFGEALDWRVAEQAAALAVALRRPVALVWSRGEALRQGRPRPPAAAHMAARLGAGGGIAAWRSAIAAPATGAALRRRLAPGAWHWPGGGDAYAVAGARTPYQLPALAVDWHQVTWNGADLPIEPGHLRGGADGYTCFFAESFLDELVHAAGQEAVSYRIGMLGGDPRLARCLSTAASLGGWDGSAGSGQGIACWRLRGSAIAVFAEAHLENGRPAVDRLVAAADVGRVVNPGLVRQQIEGGLVFGLATALGAATGWAGGLPTARGIADLHLPTLADTPDITVELIASDSAPGGVSELAVPPVAPAVANALASATGRRWRTLPLA